MGQKKYSIRKRGGAKKKGVPRATKARGDARLRRNENLKSIGKLVGKSASCAFQLAGNIYKDYLKKETPENQPYANLRKSMYDVIVAIEKMEVENIVDLFNRNPEVTEILKLPAHPYLIINSINDNSITSNRVKFITYCKKINYLDKDTIEFLISKKLNQFTISLSTSENWAELKETDIYIKTLLLAIKNALINDSADYFQDWIESIFKI